MSEWEEGVLGLAPSQGFAIFCLYYSYRKLFGLSWNFFGIFSEFLAGRLAISGDYPADCDRNLRRDWISVERGSSQPRVGVGAGDRAEPAHVDGEGAGLGEGLAQGPVLPGLVRIVD